MVAPAAAALPLVLNAGRTAGKGLMDAATGDLLVIRTQSRLGRGKKAQPVDMELHVNPAALGVAAVGAGLTLWLMQMRVGASVESVEYGHWAWPDGSVASSTVASTKRGTPPRRTIEPYTPPATPFTPFPTTSTTEVAHWVYERTEQQQRLGLAQRQGFLGNGVGSTMDSLPWWVRIASPITWLW